MKLKSGLQSYLSESINSNKPNIELYKEEIDFIKKHQLVSKESFLSEVNHNSRFKSAYIEKSNKETEELIAVMDERFLDEKIMYLKQHIDEFVYIESSWFDLLGVDSLCLEIDDVFGTYEVMLGLMLQKKHEVKMKAILDEHLQKERKYSLLFNQQDGLWELNFDLNGLVDFHEDLGFGDVCKLIYCFLFKLIEAVENKN